MDTKNFLIAKQQLIAHEVVQTLNRAGIEAVVAGGAARDWYLCEPAKDIDVFYNVPFHQGVKSQEDLGNVLGKAGLYYLKDKSLSAEDKARYQNHDPMIYSVHDMLFDSVPVQLIGCVSDALTKYCTFSLNISQAYWNRIDGTVGTPEFYSGHNSREIIQLQKGFNLHEDYIGRMNFKFKSRGYAPLIVCPEA